MNEPLPPFSEINLVPESLKVQWYREVITYPFGTGEHEDTVVFEPNEAVSAEDLPKDAIGFKFYQLISQDYDLNGERRAMVDKIYRPGSFFVRGKLISLADFKAMGQHDAAKKMVEEGISNLLMLSESEFIMFRSADTLLAHN